MENEPPASSTSRLLKVRFWEGFESEVDVEAAGSAVLSVKGVLCPTPLRFLELFADPDLARRSPALRGWTWDRMQAAFMPRIPGVDFRLGDDVPQPPYRWRDAAPRQLIASFTYNASAFYRILASLRDAGRIPPDRVLPALDDACLTLGRLYSARDSFLMRNMNNNFNMYLISRVVEHLLGPEIYNSESQEFDHTLRALRAALETLPSYSHLDPVALMGIALGKGVAFIESRLGPRGLSRSSLNAIEDASWAYSRELAIDHREKLLSMVTNAGLRNGSFTLAAILDDAAETVCDLFWMQALMERFPFFKVNLLANTAQISINFSMQMLDAVLAAPAFRSLASRLGKQFVVTPVYCPFISFQFEALPPAARAVVDGSDAVFVKGANFFETCQIVEKDAFYAFVVYGPVSRLYTGLRDYDGVFAYVPAGEAGYTHSRKPEEIVPLVGVLDKTREDEEA